MSICDIKVSDLMGVDQATLDKNMEEFNSRFIDEKERLLNSAEYTMVSALNLTEVKVDGKPVDVVMADDVEVRYVKGDKIDSIDVASGRVSNSSGVLDEDVMSRLYSDAKYVQDSNKDFTTKVIGLMNDPEKFIGLANSINELDPESDRGHAEYLKGLVGKVSGTFKSALPYVNVALNEKAERNQGRVEISESLNVATIYVSVGPGRSYMSPLEVYAHELLHTAVSFALERKEASLSGIKEAIKGIRSSFLGNEKTLDILTEKLGSREEALDVMAYLANKDTGLDEFVAYSQTNKPVMDVLKELNTDKKEKQEFRNLFEKLAYNVRKLLNIAKNKFSGLPSTNDYDRMVVLTERLMEANNKALHVEKTGKGARIMQFVLKGNERIRETVDGFFGKYDTATLQTKGGFLGSSLYIGKVLGKSLVSKKARGQLASTLASYGSLSDERSMIQSIFSEFFENDEAEEKAERLGMIGGKLDYLRSNEAKIPIVEIKAAFGDRVLSVEDKKGLNVVLDVDLVALSGDFNILDLLKDEKLIDKKIAELESKLEGSAEDKRYYKHQIDLLARFMLDGDDKNDIMLLKNAYSIANHVNDLDNAFKKEVSEEHIKVIDQLATLAALKMVDKKSKEYLVTLAEESQEGVEMFMKYADSNKMFARENLYEGKKRVLEVKGFRTDNIDKDVETVIQPIKNADELKKQGFVLVEVLNSVEEDKVKTLGRFVSTMPVRTRFHRGAISMKDTGPKDLSVRQKHFIQGSSFSGQLANANIDALEAEMMDQVNSVRSGNAPKKKVAVSPRFDGTGKLVDFDYSLSRKVKTEQLRADINPLVTIGETRAEYWSKVYLERHNREVAKFIKEHHEDRKVNLTVKGNKPRQVLIDDENNRYLWIGEESADLRNRSLWRMLPDYMRKELAVSNEDGELLNGFYLRADLITQILGTEGFALSDAKVINKMVPQSFIYGMKIAGKIWKAIIAIYKSIILLRIPTVLFVNVLSNILFSIIYFKNPLKVAKYQLKGVEALSKFVTLKEQEIHAKVQFEAAEQKFKVGKISKEELDKARIKLERIQNDLKTSDVGPLIDEGFWTQILEEMEVEEGSNIVKSFLSSKLEGAPSLVRNGLDWIWLSDTNPVVKFMQTATQYSDFVARYAHYNLMLESGADKTTAINQVRSMFVNYNKPSNRVVEWANQMGFVMFTKYFTRIQKAIAHLAKGNPIGLILVIMGQEVYGNAPDPTDSHILTKDLGNLFYNPVDSLIGAATPGAYLFVKDLM